MQSGRNILLRHAEGLPQCQHSCPNALESRHLPQLQICLNTYARAPPYTTLKQSVICCVEQKVQVVEAYQLSMLVLTLLTLPRIWGPKSRPAPKLQAPASTGMATDITMHFFPEPRWSPELGRRDRSLLSLQMQDTVSACSFTTTSKCTKGAG